jgi:NAD(P)-dependent dehydrogenase (short-subunit alcohol dehydrogenase family)
VEARVGTVVVTGSASGLGAATARRLTDAGHRVVGVDRADAEVVADLGTVEGRGRAVQRVLELSDGVVDGVVPFAGLAAATGRPGSEIVAVNYFGAVTVLEGLRPALARAAAPAAVLVSSNSTTIQPDWPVEVAEACLRGEETAARALADADPLGAYPASKAALAWYVRETAVRDDWAGAGIRLNAIAPGMVETPMTAATRTDPMTAEGMKLLPIPAGRGGRPEEVAALVAFLLGPEAGYFVGSVLFCDGGTDALLRPRAWPAVWNPGRVS